MALSGALFSATQALLAQAEDWLRQMQAEEERYAQYTGLRLTDQFPEDGEADYLPTAYASAESAEQIEDVMRRLRFCQDAMCELARACVLALPLDHARRRVMWLRCELAIITPDGDDGGDPGRSAWERRP